MTSDYFFFDLYDLREYCSNNPVYYTSLILFNWHANGGNNSGKITPQSIKSLMMQLKSIQNESPSKEAIFIVNLELLNYAIVEPHSGGDSTDFSKLIEDSKLNIVFLFPKNNDSFCKIVGQSIDSKEELFIHFCRKIIKNNDLSLEQFSGGWQGVTLGSSKVTPKAYERLQQSVEKRIKKIVFDSIVERSDLLPVSSSYIKTTHRFSARRIYSDPNELFWIVLKLGKLYIELLDKPSVQGSITFLSGSFRGTPLAVLTKTLMNALLPHEPIFIEIVDRLGPIFNITEGHDCNEPKEGGKYIYFADFCMGGTELKLVESYIHSRKGRFYATIALGSYLENYNEQVEFKRIISFIESKENIKFSLIEGK